MSTPLTLDKTAVRMSFAASVDSYDSVAELQRQVGDRLHTSIGRPLLQQSLVVDIGCGTGFLSGKLVEDCQQLLALDIALPMVKKARSGLINQQNIDYLCADAEALPLKDNSVDFLVSNLALQWCQDLESLFNEFRRVLKPRGSLRFSTFGPNTLRELKLAWAQVDQYPHVNHFHSAFEIESILKETGFQSINVQTQTSISNYPNVMDLMCELKNIGAHNVNQQRFRGLTGIRRMQSMIQAYEARRQQGLIPATFEIFFVESHIEPGSP